MWKADEPEKLFGLLRVVLDWCRDHGSWFDRRELQQIVTFIRNGGLRKAREREESRLQERESRLRTEELEAALRNGRVGSSFAGLNAPDNDDSLPQLFAHLFLR